MQRSVLYQEDQSILKIQSFREKNFQSKENIVVEILMNLGLDYSYLLIKPYLL
jgi:hypothetical protein